MAKISTYAFPSSPKSSDYVIGTDTSDSLNTKNFRISDIISLAGSTYVPYTGATGNVDLGSFTMYARNFSAERYITLETNCVFVTSGTEGLSGQFLMSQGGSLSPVWTTVPISTYVPYTGATTSVDLGANDLTARNISATSQVNLQTGAVIYTSGSTGNIGDILVSGGSGVSPFWTPITNISYKGSFYSSINQTTTINTATAVTLENTDSNCTTGISIASGSRITVLNSGVYNLAFSAQLFKTGGSAGVLDIWIRTNGSDVPNTNTRIDMANNNTRSVAAWNFFVRLGAGEYVELMWAVSDASIRFIAEAASSPHPATPSVIVTINKV